MQNIYSLSMLWWLFSAVWGKRKECEGRRNGEASAGSRITALLSGLSREQHSSKRWWDLHGRQGSTEPRDGVEMVSRPRQPVKKSLNRDRRGDPAHQAKRGWRHRRPQAPTSTRLWCASCGRWGAGGHRQPGTAAERLKRASPSRGGERAENHGVSRQSSFHDKF